MSFSWQWRLKQMMLIFLYSDFLVFILNHWCFMLWPLIDGVRPRWWWWSMLSRWTLCMIFGTCSSRLQPIWNTMHLTVCSFVYQKKKKKSVLLYPVLFVHACLYLLYKMFCVICIISLFVLFLFSHLHFLQFDDYGCCHYCFLCFTFGCLFKFMTSDFF